MTDVYDVVVVGAGLMGSSAAYFAAKAGQRVLLLERFELLHAKGSSHGSGRIFRVAYPNAVYTQLCLASLDLWHEIEKEGDVQLIRMTGELDFAPTRNADLQSLEQTLTTHKVPFEVLTGAQANERFPGFSLSSDSHAVFNPTAGVLNPTLAMRTLQKLAMGLGAVIREHSEVVDVSAEAQTDEAVLAVVELADGTRVRGRQCIVTAGAWTDKIMNQSAAKAPTASSGKMKLRPIATFGTFWECKQELYTPDKFPVFIKYGEPEIYGLPIVDSSEGVKICRHDGPSVNPETRAGVTQPDAELVHLRNFVSENFSNVDASAPSKVDHCMYTMTEDANFILDFFPVPSSSSSQFAAVEKKVVVGGGFSGHGAKMTPVIGQILADLALKGKTSQPIELFCMSRPEVLT